MLSSDGLKKNFGAIVRELRLSKGLTQEQLAECINVEMQTISAIEGGKTFVSCEVLVNLTNFFEVTPSIFFSKKVNIIPSDNTDYINEIKYLLPKFTPSKLKEIYNILLVMDN